MGQYSTECSSNSSYRSSESGRPASEVQDSIQALHEVVAQLQLQLAAQVTLNRNMASATPTTSAGQKRRVAVATGNNPDDDPDSDADSNAPRRPPSDQKRSHKDRPNPDETLGDVPDSSDSELHSSSTDLAESDGAGSSAAGRGKTTRISFNSKK
jgi:hypothetical protein